MWLRCLALFASVATAACGGSPTSPSGAAEAMTWTVNGQSFRASSNGMAALRAGSHLSLTAADCGRGASLSVQITAPDMSGPGTYPVGSGPRFSSANWTPDARSGTSAGEAWAAPAMPRVVNGVLVGGGSGSVSISSISSDWVSGSFTFEVIANPGNRDPGIKTIEGTFELSFRERTIC